MAKPDIASKIAKAAQTRENVAAGTHAPIAPVTRVKPIRVSFDLAPNSYRALNEFCALAAEETGQARVPQSDVFRQLLERLKDDEPLKTAVIHGIMRDK